MRNNSNGFRFFSSTHLDLRYIAVRKPVKYETIQTRTRVQCWVACSWIAALTLCCPPLLGFHGAEYDKNASICLLGWNVMPAYAATLSSLLLGKPFL